MERPESKCRRNGAQQPLLSNVMPPVLYTPSLYTNGVQVQDVPALYQM